MTEQTELMRPTFGVASPYPGYVLAGQQDGLGRRHRRYATGTAGASTTASLQPRGPQPARLPRQSVQEAVRGVGYVLSRVPHPNAAMRLHLAAISPRMRLRLIQATYQN